MRTTLWLKRIAATLGIGLGVILVTAVVLSVILRLPYFQAKVRAQIEHLFEANTRYEVQLDSARLDPLLRSLTILNLQVSAKGHPRQEPMVVIERTLISPNLWELLRLRLRLKSIFLYHPKVVVHAGQSEAGTGTAAEVQLKPLVMPLGATRVAVENGEVAWEWGGGGIKLSGLQSRLRSSSGGVAATVTIGESTIVSGNTSLLATDFQLDAELANDNIELKNLSLNAMGSIIEGNGRLENFRANPKLDVDLDAWGPVLDLFPRKPPIRLSGNYRLKGKLTGAIDDPIFMGEADIGQGNVDQIDIVGMTFRVDGNRNRIRLTELDVQGTEGQMQGEMTLIWDSLQYRLNLRGGGINLTRVLRPVTDQKQVGGRVAIEAEILGRGGDLSRLKGRMRAQVEAFHFLKRPEEQGRITVSLEGSGDRVHIRELDVNLADLLLKANGTLEPGEQFKVNVTANTMKLERIAGLFGSKTKDLAGVARFQGELVGPMVNPVIKGNLQWTDAKLLGVALEKVQGPVELILASRSLKSPSIEATRQDLRGNFNVGLTLLTKPAERKFKITQDLMLKVEGRINGAWQDFLGMFTKNRSKTIPITGTMELNVALQGTAKALTGQGHATIINGLVLDLPFHRTNVTAHIKNQTLSLKEITFLFQEGSISGQGEINFNGDANWEFTSTPLAIQNHPFLKNTGITGTVEVLNIKGKGRLGTEEVAASLRFNDLDYRNVPLGHGKGTFIWNATEQRSTAQLLLPERGYRFEGGLMTKDDYKLVGSMILEKGDLGSLLRIFKSDLPPLLIGNGSGKVQFSARLKDKVLDQLNAEFETADLKLHGHSFQIAAGPVLSLENQRLTIPNIRLFGEGSEINISGTVDTKYDLTIKGTAATLLASVLSPVVTGGTGVTDVDIQLQGPRAFPTYHGRLKTRDSTITMRDHPEPLQDIQGEIRFTESSAQSHGLQAQWGGGKLQIQLKGNRGPGGWNWPVEFMLQNGQTRRIIVAKTGEQLPGGATGTLEANGSVNFTTKPGHTWLSSLDGTVKLKSVDGVILRSFVLENILTAINITGLFRKGPGGKGMPYDEISATFTLEKGIAKSNDLTLRSPSIRGGGTGEINLFNQTCDAQIAIQPLQLTDRVIRGASNLPLIRRLGVGSLLFGKDQSLLVVAYHIHGPLSDLKVDHVPTGGLQGGILGIFETTLGLPVNVLRQGRQQQKKDKESKSPESNPDETP